MADSMDFNGAETQDAAFDLIPANTLVKVTLSIRPGGTGPEGWLSQSRTSSALYLNTEAVVLEGPHARRRIYTRIGFKGKSVNERGEDTYANRGRALIRGILESARGIKASDQSEVARTARMIRSLGDLNGLDFVAKVGVEKDRNNPDDAGRNVIKAAIGPEHAQYAAVMGAAPSAGKAVSAPPQTPPAQSTHQAPSAGGAPFWAR
ncbi:hypothetical protein [Chelatococcus composti]|jgi:hypothetical protein|uniref:Uncharacterized protein n=2 Tax=Hyphomicrobiales TaxID=356 RepID=A0A841KA54_9HYPH|nr:hypothetical protein [Chelatococcus composti]MBB6167764.1 hypothetical protein [Chelatococcus composti]MBS7735038.1 hypothetical protein [Chelatococcus composti]GGG36180.1 hypothetical protein GCM10008026_16180 [Chelatococcus composti]